MRGLNLTNCVTSEGNQLHLMLVGDFTATWVNTYALFNIQGCSGSLHTTPIKSILFGAETWKYVKKSREGEYISSLSAWLASLVIIFQKHWVWSMHLFFITPKAYLLNEFLLIFERTKISISSLSLSVDIKCNMVGGCDNDLLWWRKNGEHYEL